MIAAQVQAAEPTHHADRPGDELDYLVVRHLRKRYGAATAVDGVSFSVRRGELVTLLGPSGCGKTTTLRCIAGIEAVDEGEISIDGEIVSSAAAGVDLPPEKRNLGMVFQSYALWPHMTVWSNVAYPLQVRRVARREIEQRVQEALEMVGLTDHTWKNATLLSGGQQQRVALARALVYSPRVLLLDEPLSNLDAQLRESMRTEIRSLQQRVGVTAIYVTHDQAEAMAISDRVIVMNAGRIEQMGNPLDVYARPANRFVASFLGASNFLEGTISSCSADLERAVVDVVVGGASQPIEARAQPGMEPGDQVAVCVRPQFIEVATDDEQVLGTNQLTGTISRVVRMGSHVEYRVAIGELSLLCLSTRDLHLQAGDYVRARFTPDNSVCVRL